MFETVGWVYFHKTYAAIISNFILRPCSLFKNGQYQCGYFLHKFMVRFYFAASITSALKNLLFDRDNDKQLFLPEKPFLLRMLRSLPQFLFRSFPTLASFTYIFRYSGMFLATFLSAYFFFLSH